jgi:hypothetical protein
MKSTLMSEGTFQLPGARAETTRAGRLGDGLLVKVRDVDLNLLWQRQRQR